MAPIQSIIVTLQEMLISRSKAAVNVEEVRKQATALSLPVFGQMQTTKSFLTLWTLLKLFCQAYPFKHSNKILYFHI
jgi:hypothetical protein